MYGSMGSGAILLVIVLNFDHPAFLSLMKDVDIEIPALVFFRNFFHFPSGMLIMPFLLPVSIMFLIQLKIWTKNAEPFSVILKFSGAMLGGIVTPE